LRLPGEELKDGLVVKTSDGHHIPVELRADEGKLAEEGIWGAEEWRLSLDSSDLLKARVEFVPDLWVQVRYHPENNHVSSIEVTGKHAKRFARATQGKDDPSLPSKLVTGAWVIKYPDPYHPDTLLEKPVLGMKLHFLLEQRDY